LRLVVTEDGAPVSGYSLAFHVTKKHAVKTVLLFFNRQPRCALRAFQTAPSARLFALAKSCT
jgi:hypothetical protein